MSIYLGNIADTILFEMAEKVVWDLEREKYDRTVGPAARLNSAIYSEFVRRDKIGAYYEAHNKTMKNLGKFKSEIRL